jgi:hypothetical protein
VFVQTYFLKPVQQLKDSIWTLDGQNIRYLLAFKNNYFGSSQSLISASEFVKLSYRNPKTKERALKLYSLVKQIL